MLYIMESQASEENPEAYIAREKNRIAPTDVCCPCCRKAC